MAPEPPAAALASLARRPTVAAGYARGLLELAVAKGADPAVLLDASGVSAFDLADQDRRLPFSSYVALMREAKRLTNEPALALHYGEAVSLADVSVVGLFGQASETAMDAFIQLNRYARLVVDPGDTEAGERFRLVVEDRELWLVDTWDLADDFPELRETAFASMISWARGFGHGGIHAVHFRHAAPRYSAEYDRIFRVPVVFGSDRNALRIDPAAPTTQVARLPKYALGLIADRADVLLADLQQADSFRNRVEAHLRTVLHTGRANLTLSARGLGMSRATLARRLAEEGATFTGLVDDLRRRLALEYLESSTVKETAYRLGFSDPAAFSRAFKRWTGRTAREARGHRIPGP